MGWFSDLFGQNEQKTTQDVQYKYEQLPGYEDVNKLRETATGKLQDWSTQPGYGAIAPNWNDIWDLAKKKVNQYYWGSATDPGLIAKVKANAARRGQSGQPAELRNIARLGKSEADQLSEVATNQALQEALFSEQGRQNWLSSVLGFQNVKPTYVQTGSTGTTTQTSGGGEGWGLLSDIGSAALTGDWFGGIKKLLNPTLGKATVSGATNQFDDMLSNYYPNAGNPIYAW